MSHVADSIGIMTGISLAKEVKRGHTDRIGWAGIVAQLQTASTLVGKTNRK